MQFVMFTIVLTYVILVSCYSVNEFVLNTEKGSKMNKRLVCAAVAAAVILSAEWLCGSFFRTTISRPLQHRTIQLIITKSVGKDLKRTLTITASSARHTADSTSEQK